MSESKKERLDKALVLSKCVASRARAQALIVDGKVAVNGKVQMDSDFSVIATDELTLLSGDIPWVSRAALKLEHALDTWKVNPEGRIVLDIGASTGGFTQVLLARGAKKVYALDVGHDQLADVVKNDPRVVEMEGVHIKDVVKENFMEPIELIVVDVSFISLAKVLPKIKELLAPEGEAIVLVKPQFEVGKEFVKKGIVKNPALHAHVLTEITTRARGLGFEVSLPIDSPILGGDGNKEFLLLLK